MQHMTKQYEGKRQHTCDSVAMAKRKNKRMRESMEVTAAADAIVAQTV